MQVLNYLSQKLLTMLNLDLNLMSPDRFLNRRNLTMKDFNRTCLSVCLPAVYGCSVTVIASDQKCIFVHMRAVGH